MSYKRVLLKLSGEAIKEKDPSIFCVEKLNEITDMIKEMSKTTQVCVVIGAGNIWRGRIAEQVGLERIPADFMGMLGTVINGVALSSNLTNKGVETLVTSAVPAIEGVSVAYTPEVADKAMNEGKVVFLAGGTGKPLLTTDTAAAMRAIELNCDAILMGKNGVEGVFDSDPKVNPNAKFIEKLTFTQMKEMKLKVIDEQATELLCDKDIDVRVFSMDDVNNFIRVANGETIGTILSK
ncbi:MAG: UMP kinase [Bacilli bacterium]|nr:UMP kinase [Bacilli bacterium]